MIFKQKLIILFTVVLAILLYFAPKKRIEKETVAYAETGSVQVSDYYSLIEAAKKNFSAAQKSIIENLENKIRTAETENTEEKWLKVGDDFMKSVHIYDDGSKATIYKGAILCYEKALAKNPASQSAKVKLGTCYVESASLLGTQPMKGISLLREVVQKDSTNIEANLQLGLFSVYSQQFDKAIKYFRRILSIDSSQIDMYIYLGDTYLAMGEKQLAIENYENYKARIKDTLLTKNINQYINKLYLMNLSLQ
jgi:tetratricopeptide (TPR) repeat protein